jgi:hypothetical protein
MAATERSAAAASAQLPIHCAGDWGLHDGNLDLEQLEESTIGPHI